MKSKNKTIVQILFILNTIYHDIILVSKTIKTLKIIVISINS